MSYTAYRALRATLYITGSYLHSLQDDKVNESHSHNFTYKWGIEEFDNEEMDLEKRLS